MEYIKQYKDIEPDTTKYLDPVNKGMARAKCAQAQEEGAAIELSERCSVWIALGAYSFNGRPTTEYRVKPTPVITEKTEWRLYVPMGGPTMRSEGNFAGSHDTREEALDRAEHFMDWVFIDMVVITLEDGEEVSRRSVGTL